MDHRVNGPNLQFDFYSDSSRACGYKVVIKILLLQINGNKDFLENKMEIIFKRVAISKQLPFLIPYPL